MPNELKGDPKSHNISEFKDGLIGSCLCGSVTVTIKDPELFTRPRGHLCHCANCRKVAGSYVAANLIIEADKVQIEDKKGTLKTYKDYATGSGKPVDRTFCSEDGNPIKSESPLYEGMVICKLGIFPRIPKPEKEGFGLHRHDWEAFHDGVDVYEIKPAGPEAKVMHSGH